MHQVSSSWRRGDPVPGHLGSLITITSLCKNDTNFTVRNRGRRKLFRDNTFFRYIISTSVKPPNTTLYQFHLLFFFGIFFSLSQKGARNLKYINDNFSFRIITRIALLCTAKPVPKATKPNFLIFQGKYTYFLFRIG